MDIKNNKNYVFVLWLVIRFYSIYWDNNTNNDLVYLQFITTNVWSSIDKTDAMLAW